MTDIASISKLLAIAEKAIEVDTLKTDHTENLRKLKGAYDRYKKKHGIVDRVDTSDEEWDRMKVATALEYQDVEKSRRAVYNSERRLATAIRKYRHG